MNILAVDASSILLGEIAVESITLMSQCENSQKLTQASEFETCSHPLFNHLLSS